MNSGEGEGEKGDACMHTKVMSESVLARMGVNIVHISRQHCARARWLLHNAGAGAGAIVPPRHAPLSFVRLAIGGEPFVGIHCVHPIAKSYELPQAEERSTASIIRL